MEWTKRHFELQVICAFGIRTLNHDRTLDYYAITTRYGQSRPKVDLYSSQSQLPERLNMSINAVKELLDLEQTGNC